LFADRLCDSVNELGLRQRLLSFSFAKAKIAEDILTAGTNRDFTVHPFISSASNARARLSRCSMTAISSRGIAFPDFDFFLKAWSTKTALLSFTAYTLR